MTITLTPSMTVDSQTDIVLAMSSQHLGIPDRLQYGPILMGLIYGLVHVVGPDHLGTLMTLSAAATPSRAFKVGAAWGLGHSFGMVLVGVLFIAIHRLTSMSMDKWEHYGDYLIGISMIACSVYFICREKAFLVQQEDGSYVPQPCACHGKAVGRPKGHHHGELRSCKTKRGHKFCETYCQNDSGTCDGDQEQMSERDSLLGHQVEASPREQEEASDSLGKTLCDARGIKSAVLGILQGFCCPLGMVGITFMANLSIVGVVGFLLTFLLVSALGTASVAACWAYLTSVGMGVRISPLVVYRLSCGFTMTLGVTWITANYFGFLDILNYAEHLHR